MQVRAVGCDQAAPCWPMSQCRSDSSRHCARTGQLVQTAIAAAASWRAWAGSILTGYHWWGGKAVVSAPGLPAQVYAGGVDEALRGEVLFERDSPHVLGGAMSGGSGFPLGAIVICDCE